MVTLGRRIYADKSAGIILANTGEPQVLATFDRPSIESDFQAFVSLQGRDPDSVIVLELEVGAYATEFESGTVGRVNPDTLELEFSYPDPNVPEVPPVFVKPLTEQVKELEAKNLEIESKIEEKDRENKNALFEIYNLLGGE